MSSPSFNISTLAAALPLLIILKFFFSRKPKLPLPPGPKGIPILGNIFDYPSTYEWITFRDVGEQYNSDIIHYSILGESIIVLNSVEATNDLFVKRSTIYSDRPRYTMLNDMVGFAWHFAFQRYGDYWKEHRKIFHKQLEGPALTSLQHPYLLQASRNLLQHLRGRPAFFRDVMRLYAGQAILRAAYGIEVIDQADPFIVTAEKGMHAMAVAGRAGAFWVDYWPVLRYVPSWIGFKRWAIEMRKAVDGMRDAPFRFAEKALAEGTAKPSIASRALSELETNKEILGNVLAAMYAAGSDTTVSALTTFILGLVLNPAAMRKAQKEIDTHVGLDRLPDFSDRKYLPYVEALLKESLRWILVTPLAIPHRVTRDDEYRGKYRIPKGATILGNAWAIAHDKSVYGADTDAFNPDRFMNPDGVTLNSSIPHPSAAFGFGRRICVGQDMAEHTLWIAMVSILAAFDVTKAVDEQGREIEPSDRILSGMLCHPEPFKCSIVPRSCAVEGLIGVDERDTEQ